MEIATTFRNPGLWAASVTIAFLASVPGAGPARGDDFDRCFEREGAKRSGCIYGVAKKVTKWQEGKRHLTTLLEEDPGDFYAVFNLARIQLDTGEAESGGELLTRAAEGFAGSGDQLYEALARLNLGKYLQLTGRLEPAVEQLELAADLAEKAGRPSLVAQSRLSRLQIHRARGWDLEGARLELLEMEHGIFVGDDGQGLGYRVQKAWLFQLGGILMDLHRLEEAFAVNRRWALMARERGDGYDEATAQTNMAACWSEMSWREGARERALQLAEEALHIAEQAGQKYAELEALLLLGKLIRGPEGREHLERCLRDAPAGSLARSLCQFALAGSWADEDPEQASQLLAEALEAALGSENIWAPIYSWAEQFRVIWAQSRQAEDFEAARERALLSSLEVLDHIEATRSRQALEGRADFFAATTQAYHALTGYVLDAGGEPRRVDLERAFAVSEQMRARVLLDHLTSIGTEAEKAVEEEARILPGSFVELETFEQSLAQDEVAFVFQLAPDRDLFGIAGGGSWVMAVTRSGTRSYRLPHGPDVESKISLLLGLFEESSPNTALIEEVSTALLDELLGPAVADLEPGIERWVVIPDGLLHMLPFGLLAPNTRLSAVPSATLWSHWRRAPSSGSAAVLAFADPETQSADLVDGLSAEATRGVELGRLPFAREEGRRAVRRMGGASRALYDTEAGERFLKQTDLSRYGILHFATHAVLDARRPHRSAILLAPEVGEEDGLVHPKEVADLTLGGKLVVLSACQSASGKARLGEGVDSLARSFFHAGARTVVASLWRLRDDEAAAFFDVFYRHLAAGASIQGAITATRTQLRDSGARPSAWAGVVVLGDGGWTPVPGGRRPPLWWWWALGALVMVLAAWGLGKQRGKL